MASISSFEIWSKSDFAFFESLIAWSQFNKIYSMMLVWKIILFRKQTMWNRVATAQNWKKAFTHIEHRARAVGLKGFLNQFHP